MEKKIILTFLNTLCKARSKLESSFSHSFMAIFPSLVMQQVSQVCLEKKNAHMIPGVDIISRKVSVASANAAGGGLGVV